MKILGAEEIRLWDQYTIENEPVTSIDLMERAAGKCVEWLQENIPANISFSIFCGKGNNGGDGLAIGRMIAKKNYQVKINILEFGHKGTPDFQANLARLHSVEGIDIRFIQSEESFQPFNDDEIIIDALFGSGLNRKLEGVTAKLVEYINASGGRVIAVDIPSGMFTDRSSGDNIIIRAAQTLSFQCVKPAFLVAENADFLGEIHILDIGLHPSFEQNVSGLYEWINLQVIDTIHKPRKRFSHKGNFGHGLLVAGSYGKIGAAILCASACMRSGIGLLSCHIPGCGYQIMQSAVPEAMVLTDFNSSFLTKIEDDPENYEAIGIGPGIGLASETKILLRELLGAYSRPIVLDADALNILASQKDLLKLIPPGSILTPHPKEFERIFGKSENDFECIQLALQEARNLDVIIILKGHHTLIATPAGKGYFNSTGNAGMATGGSGDILTGILTGLLAQGYNSVKTAVLGVYLHGLAGDLAAQKNSMESMVAGDIIENLGKAFLIVNEHHNGR